MDGTWNVPTTLAFVGVVKDQQEVANRFMTNGALLVIGADGVVAPDEVQWLKSMSQEEWSGEELELNLSNPKFVQQLRESLASDAAILRNMLSAQGRARVFHFMCDFALCSEGISNSEFEILHELRSLLEISGELAESVLICAKADFEDDSAEELLEPSDEEPTGTPDSPQTELLDVILQQAKLPSKALADAGAIRDLVRLHDLPATVGIRTLVSWAIGASGRGGSLSQAQGKKIAVAAIQVCREQQAEAGIARKGRSAPIDQLVREHGVIALFNRNETVYFGAEDRQYAILSVSRTKGSLVIAPLDDLEAATEVTPHDLRKDTVEGDWPAEFADL